MFQPLYFGWASENVSGPKGFHRKKNTSIIFNFRE